MAMKISGPGDKKLAQKQLDKLLKEQLVGTWTYVSMTARRDDGSSVPRPRWARSSP